MWTQQKQSGHGTTDDSSRGGESGAIVAIVLVGLMVLIGCACLTVDIGMLCIRAQTVQDTVDAAALAGASQLPVPGLSGAIAEAETYVSANNEGRKAPVSITPQDGVLYYAPGDEVPGYGQLGPSIFGIAVTGQAGVDYAFAPIFGLYEDVVTRSATAIHKDPAGDKAAIFAGSDDPESAVFSYAGSSMYIEGSIHTNSVITLNGTKHAITGAVEYVNDYKMLYPDKVDIVGASPEMLVRVEGSEMEVNEKKTKVCHVREGFDFLGFTFREGYSAGKKRMVRVKYPRAKSMKAIRQRIKEAIKDFPLGDHVEDVIEEVNLKLRGWANYFRIGNSYEAARSLTVYVCAQLRIFWRRRKHHKRIQGTQVWPDSFFYDRGVKYVPSLL